MHKLCWAAANFVGPDLNGQLAGQYKRTHFRPSVNWPAVCGPVFKRPIFPGPATRQTDREMAGQILQDRVVTGRLTDQPCADRPDTKRSKKKSNLFQIICLD
ncbi:hypothetical protein BpHYR1_018678 [Brachionus plicatilis]|uniref:Uncharacterized protein n=1 Tax=Brachionus plicatilis TaxID=10195 RepID=A0A3M7T5D0_BRAPC|nr:hypothetical protein BpHYR1_018678 [Brachionus plicatilis]